MLTTIHNNFLDVEKISDSTLISFFPGAVETGGTVTLFKGETRTYSQLIDMSDATGMWKYSLYYIQDVSSNYAMSDATAPKQGLVVPNIPLNASPVALFTFYNDGSNVSMDSTFIKINR